MSEERSAAWTTLVALGEAHGTSSASRMTFRPEPAGDPDSTQAFLARRAAETTVGAPPGEVRREAAAIDDFEIIDVVGKGGMAVVSRALQRSLGREVALKRPASDVRDLGAQFLSEAQILGRLEHANIVPAHQLLVGPDGVPQLAMKLVHGKSFTDQIRGRREDGSLDDYLRTLSAVCNAVAFAHERGFIHRDLKPDNVMVGAFGEVFVMDWGIAAGLDAEACRARGILAAADATTPAGTPAYMSPELALGNADQQDERTDVYLLGACLHEVLTGKPRHTGETMREVLESAVASRPVDYGASVPPELARVANRATAARPEDRYGSVAELQRALLAFLEHGAARALTKKGLVELDELGALIESFGAAGNHAREALGREIHRHHAGALFAFGHALEIWPEDEEARVGQRRASHLLVEHALAIEDAPLATRLLAEHDDRALRARLDVLRSTIVERDRELEALRQEARRLDWSAIARPLGWVFVLAGVLGAATVFLTRHLLSRSLGPPLLVVGALWSAVMLALGLAAMRGLRGARIPDSLVSPRVVGTWGAVAVGCLAVGVINDMSEVTLARDSAFSALLIGVGFATMALQTRRWLLAPAALFGGGALLVARSPDWAYETLAGLWLLAMCGVGLALLRGASLAPGPQN